jgi:hypothetical protein
VFISFLDPKNSLNETTRELRALLADAGASGGELYVDRRRATGASAENVPGVKRVEDHLTALELDTNPIRPVLRKVASRRAMTAPGRPAPIEEWEVRISGCRSVSI